MMNHKRLDEIVPILVFNKSHKSPRTVKHKLGSVHSLEDLAQAYEMLGHYDTLVFVVRKCANVMNDAKKTK